MSSLFSNISNFVNRTQNLVNDQLGLSTDSVSPAGKGFSDTPWSGDRSLLKDEVYWRPIELDPSRWDRLYPYRLVVVDISNPAKPEIVSGPSRFQSGSIEKVNGEKGIEYLITQVAEPGRWEVVLPITPQQLQIIDNFAISTSATMRGVIEEHNGVKFKDIKAQGTTGIWPRKPTKGGAIASPTSLGTIFGGTLEAAAGVAQGVSRIAKMATGQNPNSAAKALGPDETAGGAFSTGYYQALYLGQFLEQYAQAKKNPANKNWRLVFDMPKRNESFVVTPIVYSFQQSAQNPNEMMYTMQFKAWKRINLAQSPSASATLPDLDPNLFQRIIGTIEETRRTLSRSINLVKAVRSDFQRTFNVLRQTSLAIKDVGGLAFSVIDLPRQLIDDFNETITESIVNASTAFNLGPDRKFGNAGASSGVVLKNPISGKNVSSAQKAGNVVGALLDRQRANEGLSKDAVLDGALGNEAAQRMETDPVNNVFENPEENFDLFNSISVDDLNLKPAQIDAIDTELQRVRLLTIDDFRDFRQDLLTLTNQITDNYGAGDETYSSIYGLPEPRSRSVEMTVEENEILSALFEAIQALDLLTSTKKYDDLNIQNPLEFVGGLADEAGIDFQQFPSKVLVPVPFGLTIEEIAARYMGDSSRWLEIATLNSLRSPYIDEDGFTYNFLSNAEGRQFNVDNTEDRLFIGQKITLLSDSVPAFTRKITKIEKIGEGNTLVTVDGLANLDNLSTAQNARMLGYLPGTVNSQNQIYIPVDQVSEEDDRTFNVPGINPNALNRLSKIDFLLTDGFDVAFNSIGDFRLASGLNNLIQALKVKIRTQKGSLLRHLDYGIGLNYGISVADIENGQIIDSMNEMIKGDDRFDYIESITLKLVGSTLSIEMVVRVANGDGIIPVSFDVKVA